MAKKIDDLKIIKTLLEGSLFNYFNDWIIELSNKSASSELTVIAYQNDLKFFFIFLKNHFDKCISLELLTELKPADIRAWLVSELNSGVCARSNARKLSALKSFFRFLNKVVDFPLKCINSIRQPKLPQLLPHPLKIDVIEHLLNVNHFFENDPSWVTLRDKALYMILYGAGLRIQEALNLKLKDINCYLKILGKGHKERMVPLLEKIQMATENYIKKCPYINENDLDCYVFWSVSGKRLSKNIVDMRVNKFRKENNYPDYFTPHALRHSFASHLLNCGVEMRYVQELLGHSSLATTEIYADIDDNVMMDIYKQTHPLQFEK